MSARVAFVGVGKRAQFFFRIIKALPETFELAGGYARTPESREQFTKDWDAPAYDDIGKMLDAAAPDFVVTAVPWGANEAVNLAMMDYDVPLLMETPPAGSLDGLKQLWEKAQGRKTPVGVSEQYIYRPYHRFTLQLIADGLLGDVHYAEIAMAHGYHGVSIMRHYLGGAIENPEAVCGMAHQDRLVRENEVQSQAQNIAIMRFPEGRTGVLNFDGFQYFTLLRPITAKVRGERGELNNYDLAYMTKAGREVRERIEREEVGQDGFFEGKDLKGLSLGERGYWENPFPGARLTDEEIAIATCMASMTSPNGPAYPLREGLHDHHLGMLWSQAADKGGAIGVPAVPWL